MLDWPVGMTRNHSFLWHSPPLILHLTVENYSYFEVSYLLSKLRTFWIVYSMKASVVLVCVKYSIIFDDVSSVAGIFLCCSGVW